MSPMPRPRARTLAEIEHIFDEYIFGFMQKDVEREIAAEVAGTGGGNVLAAIGLLTWTEFLGVLVQLSGVKPRRTSTLESNKDRFLEGYYRLGAEYADDHKRGADPWALRNDFVHAYALDSNVTVHMTAAPGITGGLHWNPARSEWHFVVTNYLADFLKAATRLRDEIRRTMR